MTIEQKARAYDEAVKKVKDYYEGKTKMYSDIEQTLDLLFPELKKSEDERIRKALIEYFTTSDNNSYYAVCGVATKKILAWLEKQGNVDKETYEIAEKEKYDFVSGQYIECRASFNEFKKDNSYWLEYIGNDTYIGRSDNILNQKFHITPKQLYCLFTQEHCPKENNVNEETNAPTGYGKYVDECLNEASKHFLSEGEDKYSVADLFYAGVRCGKSWFEKQDKQKFSTEAKPKFKVGDWITNGDYIWKIVEVTPLDYILQSQDGNIVDDTISYVDDEFHLWTIQDAKDGDVLAVDNMPFIYNGSKDEVTVGAYCGFNTKHMFSFAYNYVINQNIIPATKEQRDLLFQKMYEEGYEWDVNKKESKKIEQQPIMWSEDDEKMLNRLIGVLDSTNKEDYHEGWEDIFLPWLKSLKDRVQPRNKWKPSKEQIKVLNEVLNFAANHESPYWNDYIFGTLNNLIRQLKN